MLLFLFSTYIVACLRLPQANVLGREPDDVAVLVDDTCPSTARADVYPNVMVDLDMNFISRIHRILPRGSAHAAGGTWPKGQGGHLCSLACDRLVGKTEKTTG